MDQLINTASGFWAIVGVIDTGILVGAAIYAIVLWAKGVTPALLRLGNGLAKRQIAIFAKADHVSSLSNLIIDSKLFSEKNIRGITTKEDIGRAEGATLYLVYWPDWTEEIDAILSMKTDKCALIVYAPSGQGRISEERMAELDNKRHTTVVNFRGRLLNDIVASMITTSYEE
jgi:hypothetical protein